ncbi:MAG TPA: translocation/assembly module TamB domain-containing protein, partial [Bdellovibrionales bacterium]|nr:translocation/assembly module TamB domain-containing protein [Bdellovibrionales bacterium]
MKRRVFSYVVISLFFMMVGFFYRYHIPQAKAWAAVKIADLSQKYLSAKILAGDVQLSIVPFGVTLKNVTILPRGEAAKKLAPVRARSLSGGISLLSLVSGRKNLYWFRAEEPQVTIIFKASQAESPTAPEKISIPMKTILGIPVRSVQVTNMTLRVRSDDAKLVSELRDLSFEADHPYQALTVNLSTPELNIKSKEAGSALARVGVEGRLILEPSTLQISHLKIQRRSSLIIGTGLIEGDFENGDFKKVSAKGRARMNVGETKAWLKSFAPNIELPKLVGGVDAQFDVDRDPSGILSGTVTVETENLVIDKFRIGRVHFDAAYKDKEIHTRKLEVLNKAGSFSIENASLKIDDKLPVTGLVKIPGLELAQLLANLGLPKPDLHLMMSGELPCKGELKPSPVITCNGYVRGQDFDVYDDDDGTKDSVVKLKNFQVTGTVTVDKDAVRPKADLQVGTSRGKAEGRVEYKKGFWFSYTTPEVRFSDVEDLAGLDFEGAAELSGTTSGNSDYAVVDMKVKTKELWMSDFAIGNGTADLSYKAGLLTLADISGSYRTSRYNGQATINLPNKTINGNFRFPYLEANDIQVGLERKAKLPFMFSGTGSGHVNVRGPLVFTQLSYELQTHVSKGVVAGELYDNAYFNVHAKSGHVVADRVEITRGAGAITLVGDGYPDGNINTRVSGKSLMLETFDAFSDLPLSFTGMLNFNMDMKGYVFSPNVHVEGGVTQTSISQQTVADSSFQVDLNAHTIQGKGNVFGQTIRADFAYPLKPDFPLRLNLATDKWNFAPFLAFISGNARQQGYETELTGSVNLESPKGLWTRATGKFEVPVFRVRRGSLEMANVKPLRATVRDGVISVDHFYIQGDNTQLTAESRASGERASQILLTGTVDMSLLAFLTPFLQEMRGIFSISSQLRLDDSRFEVLGSGFINRGYLKLKEFPHPIEQLKADFLFSQKKIIINSFTGLMAGGRASADGTIQIGGYKDFPAQIQIRLDEVTLKVPEGVTTQGSAQLSLTGNWFPYLLAGSYVIKDGLMDRAFEGQADTTIRRSSFLPKIILQDTFEPIKMDIETSLIDTFKVKNALIDAQFAGQMRLKGTVSNPVLLGDVRALRGGNIFFRETPFEILTGNVRFDNPQEINPVLYVTAQSRVQAVEYTDTAQAPGTVDQTGQDRSKRTRQYEVNLLLQGTQKNTRITLTSQPPLEEHDIISLLALGVTSQQLER